MESRGRAGQHACRLDLSKDLVSNIMPVMGLVCRSTHITNSFLPPQRRPQRKKAPTPGATDAPKHHPCVSHSVLYVQLIPSPHTFTSLHYPAFALPSP